MTLDGQLALFDPPSERPNPFAAPAPTARHTDPDTSHAAAALAAPRATTNRAAALAALRAAGDRGLTDFELADITGVAQTSIGVRRKELRDAGLVEATGDRRPAPSGALATVWRAVPNPPTEEATR